MFVEISQVFGWPDGNGIFTIWVCHVTLCMAYVAVIIQSRIRELDRSLEEAALDLGATPLKVFFAITLPLILPALADAWLLALTLSLDDVVLASFLSGPGYTTLPLDVFSRVRLGLKTENNALDSLFMMVFGIFLVVAHRIQWPREYRKRVLCGRSVLVRDGFGGGRQSSVACVTGVYACALPISAAYVAGPGGCLAAGFYLVFGRFSHRLFCVGAGLHYFAAGSLLARSAGIETGNQRFGHSLHAGCRHFCGGGQSHAVAPGSLVKDKNENRAALWIEKLQYLRQSHALAGAAEIGRAHV